MSDDSDGAKELSKRDFERLVDQLEESVLRFFAIPPIFRQLSQETEEEK